MKKRMLKNAPKSRATAPTMYDMAADPCFPLLLSHAPYWNEYTAIIHNPMALPLQRKQQNISSSMLPILSKKPKKANPIEPIMVKNPPNIREGEGLPEETIRGCWPGIVACPLIIGATC